MISILLWVAAGAAIGVAAGFGVLLELADVNPTVQASAAGGLARWLGAAYGLVGAVGGLVAGLVFGWAARFGLTSRSVRLGGTGLAVAAVLIIALEARPLLALAAATEPSPAREIPAPAAIDAKVLLLGLDGVEWRVLDPLMAEGLLPNFAALVANGARAPLETLMPTWSPLIWNTIATGVEPEEHGIVDFGQMRMAGVDCGPQRLFKHPVMIPHHVGFGPVLRVSARLGLAREVPVSGCHRRVKALWNQLDDAGRRVAVINWFASYPAEEIDGYVVSDNNPMRAAFLRHRHGALDGTTERITHPPSLLGRLGGLELDLPPEEPADAVLDHAIFADLEPDAREQLRAGEEGLLRVARMIIGADLFAAEAAKLLFAKEQPDFTALYMSGIDNISHRFGRQKGVVRRFYQLVDGLIGEILAAAGPETTVVMVSDHGWEYEGEQFGHFYAPDGVFLVSGPGARAGTTLGRTPRVHDVASTVLALFGLPASERSVGTAVLDALEPARLALVPSLAIDYGRYGAPVLQLGALEPGELEHETMDKLRVLGYVE